MRFLIQLMVSYFQLGVSLRSSVSQWFIAFAGKFTAETQRTLRYAENIFKLGHRQSSRLECAVNAPGPQNTTRSI